MPIDKLAGRRRVCIYGGTDADRPLQRFVRALVPALLDRLDCQIISGGVKHDTRSRPSEQRSVDAVVLEAARQHLGERELRDRFEAWVPGKSTRQYIQRMGSEDGITVSKMEARTDLGRRLRLVRDVDLLVTIKGRTHTATVLEQAIELNRPALPLPFTGGDSERFWNDNREQIEDWFPDLSDRRQSIEGFHPAKAGDAALQEVCRLIAEVMASARFTCLVLEPYNATTEERYKTVLQPAAESLMVLHRVDRDLSDHSIFENFERAVRKCQAILADVSDANSSVMYELGFARARGIRPFLYSQEKVDPEQLPIYLRRQNVRSFETDESLRNAIRRYLEDRRQSVRGSSGQNP